MAGDTEKLNPRSTKPATCGRRVRVADRTESAWRIRRIIRRRRPAGPDEGFSGGHRRRPNLNVVKPEPAQTAGPAAHARDIVGSRDLPSSRDSLGGDPGRRCGASRARQAD
jgi:hypothetical protein